MSKRKKAAAVIGAAVAIFATLAVIGSSSAQATPTTSPAAPVQVRIYLENQNHNPGAVTTSCGESGPLLHTALFNDAVGANVVETAKIYREVGSNPDLWPVVFGPVDVPIGGNVPVTLAYIAGAAYNAVAIPKGDPWPATSAEIVARMSAHPPTADNSQLFASGYPAAPVDCPTPSPTTTVPTTTATTPHPCQTVQVPDSVVVTPTCTPTTKPTTTQPTTATSTTTSPAATTTSAATSSPVPSSTGVTTTSAAPSPSDTATTATTAAGGLAHTGASVVPWVAAAMVMLLAGGGCVVYALRGMARRH